MAAPRSHRHPGKIRRAPGIGGTLLETEKGVGLMLAAGQVAATLAVSDVDRARKFYTETLGFTPMMEDPAMGTLYGGGKGTMFLVYWSEFAGTNKGHCDDDQRRRLRRHHRGTAGEGDHVPGLRLPRVLV